MESIELVVTVEFIERDAVDDATELVLLVTTCRTAPQTAVLVALVPAALLR